MIDLDAIQQIIDDIKDAHSCLVATAGFPLLVGAVPGRVAELRAARACAELMRDMRDCCEGCDCVVCTALAAYDAVTEGEAMKSAGNHRYWHPKPEAKQACEVCGKRVGHRSGQACVKCDNWTCDACTFRDGVCLTCRSIRAVLV